MTTDPSTLEPHVATIEYGLTRKDAVHNSGPRATYDGARGWVNDLVNAHDLVSRPRSRYYGEITDPRNGQQVGTWYIAEYSPEPDPITDPLDATEQDTIPGPAALVNMWRDAAHRVLVDEQRSTAAVQGAVDISRAHTLNDCADQLETAMRHIAANMLHAHGITITEYTERTDQ